MPCIRTLLPCLLCPLLFACDEDRPNTPPTLDWALTVPAEDSFTFQRREQKGMAFDITDAVEDLDGDPLFSAWYWVDSEGVPHFLFGTLTMTFDNPCDLKSFSTAPPGSFISVVAVVSDHDLTWAQFADPTQPVQTSVDADGNPHPLVKRMWMVELVDTCP